MEHDLELKEFKSAISQAEEKLAENNERRKLLLTEVDNLSKLLNKVSSNPRLNDKVVEYDSRIREIKLEEAILKQSDMRARGVILINQQSRQDTEYLRERSKYEDVFLQRISISFSEKFKDDKKENIFKRIFTYLKNNF